MGPAPGSRQAESILDELRVAGCRITASRRLVVDVLAGFDDHHLTAADIVAGVQEVDASVHETTVYRTLEKLQQVGVIAPLASSDRSVAYQLSDHGHDHAHLVCTRCGSASEVPPELLAGAARTARADHGFEVSVHRSPLYGTCAACR